MWKNRWFRRLVWALLLFIAAAAGFNKLLATRRVHGYLVSRLSAAFGRPVEVSNFSFNLLGGLRFEANYVTVAEDPRFGYEYFLRAEKISVSPRWRSLARGRFDFGTLTLTRPSLNLVRLPDGQWNIESWLPPLEASVSTAAGNAEPPRAPVPPYVLKLDAGRINFKRGADKHPFAFVDVNGRVDQESGGRFRIDLEAHLARAAVVVQEAGTLRVRGRVGGTSARLRPAELTVTWEEASLADALRLLRGWDYGIRGQASVELNVTSGLGTPQRPPASLLAPWEFSGTLRVLDLHRWDLPQRPADPAFNVHLQARWWPERARVEIQQAVFEAARSNLRASGFVEWALPGASGLHIVSSGVHLDDLLAAYRAFHPDVAAEASLDGIAGVDADLAGWPPRIVRGVLATDGARFTVPGLDTPVAIGRGVVRVERDTALLLPTNLTLPNPRDLLRLDASATLGRDWGFSLNLNGQTSRIEDLQTVAGALGWPRSQAWSVQGPAGLRLRWHGRLFPFSTQPEGTLDFRGVRLQPPFLTEPVVLAAQWEFHGQEQRIALNPAMAFGARWTGTLTSRGPGLPWEFALSADQLDVAAVNRAVRRSLPGLLERMVPLRRDTADSFLGLDAVHAGGTLSVARLLLAPLEWRRFRVQLNWQGRRLELSAAEADFYSGVARGSFRAEFGPQPAYDSEMEFSRLDLAQLSNTFDLLRGHFSGKASGELALAARGADRDTLINSLEGRGKIEVRDAQFRGLQLLESLAAGRALPGASTFHAAGGEFVLSSRAVEAHAFRLSSPSAELELEGRADFSAALDLLFHVLPPPPGATARTASLAGKSFRVTGPLASPQLSIVETAPPPRP